MTSLSSLNKKEREIRGDITRLRKQVRDKKMTKKEFEKIFEKHSKELERISQEKSKLIGLPPLPPPPKPGRSDVPPAPPARSRDSDKLGLDAIKKGVVGKKPKRPLAAPEPPKPPSIPAPPAKHRRKKAKAPAKEIIKERIREVKVPVVKERIREVKVPVVKERIREVKVPVIQERIKEVRVPVIKEVPVVKTVKVPSGDPELASKIEKDFENLASKISENEKEIRKLETISDRIVRNEESINNFQNGLNRINEIEMEVRNLQSLAQRMRENEGSLKALQEDLTRNEQEVSGFIKELREAVGKVRNIEDLGREVESVKSKMRNIDFEGLTKEIYGQFDKMNTSIKEAEKKNNELVEKMNVEMKGLREKAEEAKRAREHVEDLDVKGIRRDMEALKQKSQYIETHIERVDIRPLVDMIQQVENKVEALKASSALIIE